jgi:hypothetical protein
MARPVASECARSKQGREKPANWIKEIESGKLRQAADTGVPAARRQLDVARNRG